MNREALAILNFDEHIKGRRRASFQNCFLRAAPTRFFIRESHRFDAADEIAERGVE